MTEQNVMLTEAEHEVVRRAGELWGAICTAIPDGPTRDADLQELVAHVHAIQHAIMANAAARAYPDTYRMLGGTLRKQERHELPNGERECLCEEPIPAIDPNRLIPADGWVRCLKCKDLVRSL